MTSGLFTDFYELTMAQGYWKQNMNNRVVFDMFFRKNPFNNGFSVLAGNEPLLDELTSFSFSDDDVAFLQKQGLFDSGFLDYLKGFHFSGDVYMMDEGSIVFPQEPVIRISAPLIEAQIIEGIVLNYINFQSLIATKTARIWLCSKKAPVMEFGLRRAQGPDGAMSATRAAYIGGVAGTSNTLAAKVFGIPVMGTMAHSWVMSFDSELEAFEKYAELYPENSVFLIDTYDTLGSGIKNAIKAGKKLVQQGHNFGVRLDSGDIEYLARQVRRELDNAGLKSATISASNDLTEEIISTLVANKTPIDSWGVGTNLVTGGYESAFTGVYKLCGRYNAQAGCIQPTMKFSDNPAKMTNPGVKNVFRLYDENGMAGADIIGLENDTISENVEQRFFHPLIDYRQFTFTPAKVESLLKKRVENGKRITPPLTASEQIRKSRSVMEKQLETFDESYKRLLNPHVYKVSLTENLKELKKTFIEANIK